MTLEEKLVPYNDGDVKCEGFYCYDPSFTTPLPVVMINSDWSGRGEFAARKARRLAWHGYAAFCVDMYGGAKRGKSTEENQALIAPFMQDRTVLARRMNAALNAARGLPQVDPKRVAAMGFCFGGLCVLDLARSGADVRGVASFHGLLKPSGLPAKPIKAKVLVMHGYDDPMAPPEEVLALAKELTAAGADWQLHAYGRTMHAFTNPEANNPSFGTVYKAEADRRSWHTLINFLEEVLR